MTTMMVVAVAMAMVAMQVQNLLETSSSRAPAG